MMNHWFVVSGLRSIQLWRNLRELCFVKSKCSTVPTFTADEFAEYIVSSDRFYNINTTIDSSSDSDLDSNSVSFILPYITIKCGKCMYM